MPGLYEKILRAAGGRLPPPRPPRASAAVVPWRRVDGRLEAYWVRRAESLPFMGGWHAFPGGGLSRGDAELPVAGEPRGLDAAPPAGDLLPEAVTDGIDLAPDVPEGLVGCALRELFEETGLLVARRRGGGALPGAERVAAGRRRLLAGETSFADLLADWDAELDASRLVWAGRWLTPKLGPLRFDNRFFLLEWPGLFAPRPAVDGEEVVEGEWVAPAEVEERWRSGAVTAAPPILHLMKVLAEDGPEAGLPRLAAPREANLGPFRKVEFRPGVLLFPLTTLTLPPAGHTHAYLVGHGDAVLVDPGAEDPDEVDRLLAALEAARHDLGRRVHEIWLTHHHPDHVGGVERVRSALDVPVAAHLATARRLAERRIRVDRALTEGDRIRLDGEPPMDLRVLHTPGHARGHLCFLDEAGGALVSGDMVAGVGTIVIDPPEGNMDDYLASLERLRDLAPRTLFPSHGPMVRDAVGKLDEYLEHRRWREERVLAAWRGGRRDPAGIVPEVYDDAPREAWPLAERQVVAHLERLERAGRLDTTTG